MVQRARFKVLEALRSAKERTVVVSTDVAARGLDILSVDCVIHYDVARTADGFVHRAGRTAVSGGCPLLFDLFLCNGRLTMKIQRVSD